ERDRVYVAVARILGRAASRRFEQVERFHHALLAYLQEAERVQQGWVLGDTPQGVTEDGLGGLIAAGRPIKIGEVDRGWHERRIDFQRAAKLCLCPFRMLLPGVEERQVEVSLGAIGRQLLRVDVFGGRFLQL